MTILSTRRHSGTSLLALATLMLAHGAQAETASAPTAEQAAQSSKGEEGSVVVVTAAACPMPRKALVRIR
jgi:hypothetical protein